MVSPRQRHINSFIVDIQQLWPTLIISYLILMTQSHKPDGGPAGDPGLFLYAFVL